MLKYFNMINDNDNLKFRKDFLKNNNLSNNTIIKSNDIQDKILYFDFLKSAF